jgi:hypothetical protein
MQAYQALVEDLKALGVEHVFGLMRDDAAVCATALDSAGSRFYGARHENGAIAMAEGYAYRSNGFGVAVVGRGPATAKGLTRCTLRQPRSRGSGGRCFGGPAGGNGGPGAARKSIDLRDHGAIKKPDLFDEVAPKPGVARFVLKHIKPKGPVTREHDALHGGLHRVLTVT